MKKELQRLNLKLVVYIEAFIGAAGGFAMALREEILHPQKTVSGQFGEVFIPVGLSMIVWALVAVFIGVLLTTVYNLFTDTIVIKKNKKRKTAYNHQISNSDESR